MSTKVYYTHSMIITSLMTSRVHQVHLVQRDLPENPVVRDQPDQLETRDPGVHWESKGSLEPKDSRDQKEQLGHTEILDQLEHLDLQLVHKVMEHTLS